MSTLSATGQCPRSHNSFPLLCNQLFPSLLTDKHWSSRLKGCFVVFQNVIYSNSQDIYPCKVHWVLWICSCLAFSQGGSCQPLFLQIVLCRHLHVHFLGFSCHTRVTLSICTACSILSLIYSYFHGLICSFLSSLFWYWTQCSVFNYFNELFYFLIKIFLFDSYTFLELVFLFISSSYYIIRHCLIILTWRSSHG